MYRTLQRFLHKVFQENYGYYGQILLIFSQRVYLQQTGLLSPNNEQYKTYILASTFVYCYPQEFKKTTRQIFANLNIETLSSAIMGYLNELSSLDKTIHIPRKFLKYVKFNKFIQQISLVDIGATGLSLGIINRSHFLNSEPI